MNARDIIPLKAIANAGSLHVPFVLSQQTANRLEGMGLIALEEAGRSAKGRSIHYLAYLTEAGWAVVNTKPIAAAQKEQTE